MGRAIPLIETTIVPNIMTPSSFVPRCFVYAPTPHLQGAVPIKVVYHSLFRISKNKFA
jgi:hypothetical protein